MLSRFVKTATAIVVLMSSALAMLSLPVTEAAALNGNPTIQILVPAGSKSVDDLFTAVVKVSDIETTASQIAVKFDPSVVKVVDVNGNFVPDDTAQGLTQGNNSGISVLALVNNTQGLVKYALMWFTPYLAGTSGTDFVSIRFKAISAGNPDIHFATDTDNFHDPTAPSGYVVAKAGQSTMCTLIQPSFLVLNRADVVIRSPVPDDVKYNLLEPDGLEQSKPEALKNISSETPVTPVNDQTVWQQKFNDTVNHWAKGNIERMVASGAVKGYSDGSFKPDARITRAEFTVLLANALGLATEVTFRLSFSDHLSIPVWAQPKVAAVAKRGIVGGYADGSFRASNLITRAEISTMAVKALQLKGQTGSSLFFSDNSKIPNWAKEPVLAAVENGIISGYADNTFRANNMATRAEAVTIVARMLDFLSLVKQ